MRRLLQHGGRLSGRHVAPPGVPWPLSPLLGQRPPSQRGDVLRAGGGAAGLPESPGPRQQHLDLCRPSRGLSGGQEERACSRRYGSAGRVPRRSCIPRIPLREEETGFFQLREIKLIWDNVKHGFNLK